MSLNKNHIELITKAIIESETIDKDLQDDLLDHYCCTIEHDMKKGAKFDDAFSKAFKSMNPTALKGNQDMTLYLLNSKKNKSSIQILWILGFIGAVTLSTGLIFRLVHQPGANILSLFGIAIFIFVFFPMLFIRQNRMKIRSMLSEKVKLIFAYLTTCFFGAFLLFLFMGWPGTGVFLVLCLISLNFGVFPFIFIKTYKKQKSHEN
ncbi:MAG: hypothetical protein B6I20_11025 [Bacteroidetes bacterium 4572_117]|nr:MAG: hypothetical protein B6I20_11025 [Bacteroidetes bacterium 4572_117]